jgi:hypothetical protein
MMFKSNLLLTLVLCVTTSVALAGSVTETFGDDPVANGRATVAGSNQSTDTANSAVAPFVVGTPGVLTHNQNSNWRNTAGVPDTSQHIADASRLEIPLGATYTDDDSFSFGATLRVNSAGFFRNSGFQFNFGLVNATDTGMDRTGNTYFGDPAPPASPSEGTTYNSVEWNYFPDNTPAGYPTCQQVVMGEQGSATSAFTHFAANFFALLPTDTYAYGLPHDLWMDVVMDYDGASRTMTLTVKNAGSDLVDKTSVPDLVLAEAWFDSDDVDFSVDTLAIMNYQDFWAFGAPSLVAKVEYDEIWFAEAQPVPEASVGSVLLVGLLGLARRRRRRG